MTSPPPRIQGNILTYQQSGQPAQLLVDTSSWYAWLATASTFTFQSDTGPSPHAKSVLAADEVANTGRPTAGAMGSSTVHIWASLKS